MRKYEMVFNAPQNEQAEQAARLMDKVFRRWYNVYGGKRVYSGKGANGEWYIFMEYTAKWEDSPMCNWPDFDDIRRGFMRKLWKVDKDNMVEVHSRLIPEKG